MTRNDFKMPYNSTAKNYKLIETLKYTCCFCNKSIESSKTDPCDVNLIINIDKEESLQYSQDFYCHVACFRTILHEKIRMHFHLHNILDDPDEM